MSEHRAILRIAVPSILSNITVPLLGWVDTAIAVRPPVPMRRKLKRE